MHFLLTMTIDNTGLGYTVDAVFESTGSTASDYGSTACYLHHAPQCT